MSAAAAAGTQAGAWERLRTESGTGGRRGRLARTQIVEVETAATVVPQEAREEGLLEASPDTLCATGSLTPPDPPPVPTEFRVYCRPSPTRAFLPVLAAPTSSCRGPRTRPGIPRLHGDRGRASARLAIPGNPVHALALRSRARLRTAGGAGSPQRAEASDPVPGSFLHKGAQVFVERTLCCFSCSPNWD